MDDLTRFLSAVLGLYNDIFNAIWTVPLFRFFLAVLLLCSIVAFFSALVRRGKNGRL